MASSTRTAYLLLLVGLLALAAVTAAYAHDHGDDDHGDDDDNESRISHWRNFFPTPRNCARDTERIQNDSVIQDFTAANVNCTSGKCNAALEDMKDRCRELRGGVCSTKATFTKSDTDGAPRESMTSYRCVPRTCRMDENEHEFRIATRMYERGYSNVHVHFKCHGTSGGGDVAWHALKFVALLGFLIFACFEKKRRYRNGMAQAWPANGTRGTMRTKLCGCCGCSAGCWRALFCALPLSTFNRAELDGRAWRWADFLCMHPGVAYFNRQTIRRKLDAKPQPCRDFIKTVLCYPWVVAQNTREIEHGFVGNVDAPLAQPIGQAFATNIAPGSVVQLTETKV